MNQLTTAERAQILACLVEGNSMRATCRITGFAKKTVSRFAEEIGVACERFSERVFTNLPCRIIQCDEIWSFVGSKERNTTPEAKASGKGDCWTWIAIDPESKLVPCWLCGDRSAASGYKFMRRVSARLDHRVQLSTDGLHAYLVAVEAAFAFKPIDFAQVVKIYGNSEGSGRYSPAGFVSESITVISGDPKPDLISTSHAERNNLTVRMQSRRFTRLTNGFSKKFWMHRMAVALHFVHYNFCRIHSSIRVTPAMEAGLTDHVWTLDELAGLLQSKEGLQLAA